MSLKLLKLSQVQIRTIASFIFSDIANIAAYAASHKEAFDEHKKRNAQKQAGKQNFRGGMNNDQLQR